MYRLTAIITLAALIFLLVSGCSSEQKPEEELGKLGAIDPQTGVAEPEFTWQKLEGPTMTFYYQPDDSLAVKAVKLRDMILEVYTHIGYSLGLEPLIQIEFYCYRDMKTMTHHTSRDAPFFVDNKFYYGYGFSYGRAIALYVMANLPEGETEIHFLREGLTALFDFSGRNYHHTSNNFLVEGRLTPVINLAGNASYDKLNRSKRLVEAASLCGYLMYKYGAEKVMQIYHSQESFSKAFPEVIGIDLTQLEQEWRAFLPEHTLEKERERQQQQEGNAS